jgi:hypothetical protein
MVLLGDVLSRALIWSGVLNRREEVLHIDRKIGNTVIVCNCSDGAKVDTFLTRIGCNVCPYLLEKIEDMSATKVCRRCPFFSPGAPQEETSQEVEMDAIPAEAKARLGLRILYCQIDIPTGLPQLESCNCRSK